MPRNLHVPNEFVTNDGVTLFTTDLAIERGDIVGLVVVPGSGVGARATAGATTQRWIPHVGNTRRPDFPAGQGWNDEVLLRVELIPGGKTQPPHQVGGSAAVGLPSRPGTRPPPSALRQRPTGRDRRRRDRPAVGARRAAERAPGGADGTCRGFARGGRIIYFDVSVADPLPDSVDIFIEYSAENSERILTHFYGADPRVFEFIN